MSSSRRFIAGIPPKIATRPAPVVRPADHTILTIDSALKVKFGEHVLRGERAGIATSVELEVDLTRRGPVPAVVMERLRAEGHAAGYAAGWAQGRQEARVAVEAVAAEAIEQSRLAAEDQRLRVDRALTALAVATHGLERRVVPSAEDTEEAVVATAFVLAEAVIGRELALAAEPGAEAMARALDLAPKNRPVTVRLNPGDLATIGAGTAKIDGRTVTLVADGSLSAGDAIAECDATTIDARLGPALDRAREVLGLS